MKENNYLSTEMAMISGVLLDFELLDDLSEGSTVSGTIFTGNTNFNSSLGHFEIFI
jgi:hypothetical protein